MSTDWQELDRNRSLDLRAKAIFKSLKVRFRHRIDAVWFALVLAIFILLILGWLGYVLVGQRLGIFDPPPIQPLQDCRILTNVRDNIRQQTLLDAVFHLSDRRIYISQQGGKLHRYDPYPKLWTTIDTGLSDQLLDPDLILLRSGNGTDPRSFRIKVNPGPEPLWALTGRQGLVYSQDGKEWTVVVGDSTFVGSKGKPVEQAQLTAAAVSGDRQWLMVGTREEGIGIYHLESRRWLTLQPGVFKALPSNRVTHMAWCQNYFWIGGPSGLAAVKMKAARPYIMKVTGIDGQIRDLDVDPMGRLWVLEKRQAHQTAPGRLRLGWIIHPGRSPVWKVEEQNIYPQLKLEDLHFAQYWDNHLVAAGDAGLYSYDARRHSWKQHFTKPVLTTLALPDGKGFYFGYVGGIGRVVRGSFEPWNDPGDNIKGWLQPISGEKIVKLHFGKAGEVLALSESGNVFNAAKDKVDRIFESGRTTADPKRFNLALSFGNTVLFIGQNNATAHNIVTRTYKDIASKRLPYWLTHQNQERVTTGDTMYIAAKFGQNTELRSVPIAEAADLKFSPKKPLDTLPGSTNCLRNWGNQGIALMSGGEGSQVIGYLPGKQIMIGPKVGGMNGLEFLDAAPYGQGMMVAARSGLRHYHYSTRSWDNFFSLPGWAPPVELVNYGGQLLVKSQDNRLFHMKSPNNFGPVIGGQWNGRITDDQLSDAKAMGNQLVLAGNATIYLYDPGARTFTQTWNLPVGSGPVNIKGFVNDQPLALCQGRAFIGDQMLDGNAGRVFNLTTGGNYIWTVRQKSSSGSRYLKGYPINDPFGSNHQCFFQNPGAGSGVAGIQDAVVLPELELIAVSTNQGLRFYSPRARSWMNNDPLPGGHFYLLPRYLVIARPGRNGFKLTSLQLDSINVPGPCSNMPISFTTNDITARAFSVDRLSGRLAYIDSQGAVLEWDSSNDKRIGLLSPPGDQPAPGKLKRIFDRTRSGQGHLLFTTDSEILRYDLVKRTWSAIPLDIHGSPGSLPDIVLEKEGDQEIVVAKTVNGEFFWGTFPSPQTPADMKNRKVKMERIYHPGRVFNQPGHQLLDVQAHHKDVWTFVLKDRIKYYNPVKRTWGNDVVIENAYGSPVFGRLKTRRVVASHDGGSKRTWWVAHHKEVHPVTFARYDHQPGEMTAVDDDGTIWTLDQESNLFKYRLPDKKNTYQKKVLHEQPLPLEPGEVNQAFKWKDFILFDTRQRLRIFDVSSRKEIPLTPEESSFTSIIEVLDEDHQLWLRDQSKRLLVLRKAKTGTRSIETGLFPMKVSILCARQSGDHWVYVKGTGWKYWDSSKFSEPIIKKEIKLFVTEGTDITGIDDNYIPYWRDGRLMIPGAAPLPPPFTKDTITSLWRGLENDWWVVEGNHLYHLVPDICPNPKYTPPTGKPAKPGSTTPTSIEPETIPCYKEKAKIQLPSSILTNGAIIFAKFLSSKSLVMVNENGNTVTVKKRFLGGYKTVEKLTPKHLLPGRLGDQWPSFKQWVVRLPSGTNVFDPITQLVINYNKRLLGRRPSGDQLLASYGAMQINLIPAPLNAGWLKWDRGRKLFQVRTPTGLLELNRNQFIQNNQLIFEEVNALMAVSSKQLFAGNRHGIWEFSKNTLDLTDHTITFQRVQWSDPFTAAHGCFITNTGLYKTDGSLVPPAGHVYQVIFGDVTLSEKIRDRKISGIYKIHGGPGGSIAARNAFAAKGFMWDQNKRGLAYSRAGLLVQSDAGIHLVVGHTGFDTPPGPGRLYSEQQGQVYFASGSTWYLRQSLASWKSGVTNPIANRVLVDNRTWKWELRKGQLQMQLAGKPFQFKLSSTSEGLSFTSDRLVDAAVYNDRLFVMTEAFLEVADPWDLLANLQAQRYPFQPTDRLRTISDALGQVDLVRTQGNSHYAWNDSSARFLRVTPSNHPRRKRLVAIIPGNNPRLHFYSDPNGITKELKVRNIQGRDSWIPFDFQGSRFPIDVVTSIAVRGNELYIGTKAGLQVYRGNSGTGLNDIMDLYQLSRQSTGYLVEVNKVGVPVGNPQLVLAQSSGGCFEVNPGANPGNCPGGVDLTKRLRLQTNFWRFFEQGNRLEGQYKDERGRFVTGDITVRKGRLPHDYIKDIAAFDNKAFTLWSSGWITTHPNLSLGLNNRVRNYNKRSLNPQRFVIVPRDADMERVTVPRGLYFEGLNRRVWKYDGAQWKEIKKSALVNGILEYADRPPIINRKQLRLLQPRTWSSTPGKRGLTFEQRSLNGSWQALPWENGRVAIDKWSEFLYLDNRVWAATPTGIVNFTRNRTGQVVLDPDKFILIKEPQANNKIPLVTEMQGNTNPVTIRCETKSEQVYQGNLDGKADRNVFTHLHASRDPFVNKTLVLKKENGFWEWQRKDCKDFHPGQLTGKLHGEEIALIGGRFNFDTINSIAFFKENHVEIATDAGGYYRAPHKNLHVQNFVRPQMPGVTLAAIKAVRLTQVNNRTILGLKTNQGDYILWGSSGESGRVQHFPEYLGEDGFWRYFKEDTGLTVTASRSIGGTTVRQLEKGRFTDDMVIGLPVIDLDKTGINYVIPTRAGVLCLDGNLKTSAIYSRVHLNFSGDQAPRILFIANQDNRKETLYLLQGNFYPLNGPAEPYPYLKFYLPGQAEVFAVEEGPQDFVRIRWKIREQRRWTLVNYEDTKKVSSNEQNIDNLYVNISEFSKFDYYRMAWGNIQPWMQIHLNPTSMQTYRHGASQGYQLGFPQVVHLLTPIMVDETLYLIGKISLFEINLEHAMIETIRE